MKTLIPMLALAGLCLAGCSKEASDQATTVPATVPVQVAAMPDLGNDGATPPPIPGVDAAPAAVAAVVEPAKPQALSAEDLEMLNYAVYMYQEEFGRLPKSLQEMIGTRHLTRLPVLPAGQSVQYDPQTGAVSVQ